METLREHVLLSLELIENERSRLFRFGHSLNKNFTRILKYSIIFHDFGKIFHNKYYFNANQTLSFDGHEIISCWGANEHLKMLEDYLSETERGIIVLTILFHHHPMNIKERFERLKNKHEKVNTEFFDLFYEELQGVIEQKNISVNKDIREISEEVCGKWGLLKNLWKNVWMNSDSNTRKTLLLAIQALVATDYYSAHKSKKRVEGSTFIDVINTFIKFHMTSSYLDTEG